MATPENAAAKLQEFDCKLGCSDAFGSFYCFATKISEIFGPFLFMVTSVLGILVIANVLLRYFKKEIAAGDYNHAIFFILGITAVSIPLVQKISYGDEKNKLEVVLLAAKEAKQGNTEDDRNCFFENINNLKRINAGLTEANIKLVALNIEYEKKINNPSDKQSVDATTDMRVFYKTKAEKLANIVVADLKKQYLRAVKINTDLKETGLNEADGQIVIRHYKDFQKQASDIKKELESKNLDKNIRVIEQDVRRAGDIQILLF